ncbi:unnamed protein product [Calypogeia fissa]
MDHERRRSCWSELDRRRSYSQRKSQMVRKASWVERKSLWDSMLEGADEKEADFQRHLDDLEHLVSNGSSGVLFALFRCLQCAMCLDTKKPNPLLNHLYRVLLPQLIGWLYMNEPLCYWQEDLELGNTDEIVLKCLVYIQDLCSDLLRFLTKPQDEENFVNAMSLLRIVTLGIDKATYFHRTHKFRRIPTKEFSPYGVHHFTKCISGDDTKTKMCTTCHKEGASSEYRWITTLLENFGQANWTNYEFLARVLENPRSFKKLPLEATEAILAFVAKAIEFLDPTLAQAFLPGSLAVMELMVQHDEPGARPSDRFISNILMIDKHLDAIFGYILQPDAKEWLMQYVRVCKYRDLLGYKPNKLW